MKRIISTIAAISCAVGAANAAPVTFFGENLAPGGAVTGAPVDARNDFLASLSGNVGIEDFEAGSLANLLFPGSNGSITATLSGGGASIASGSGAGRFATSGNNFVETDSGGDFLITFSSAISAFGFFATDVGDFGNRIVLTLENGTTQTLEVPNTQGAGGSTDGSLLFFGFIDPMNSYTSILFENTPGGTDVFGFDDMIIGDIGQVITDPIPLPAAAPLFAMAAGAGYVARRRKQKKTA